MASALSCPMHGLPRGPQPDLGEAAWSSTGATTPLWVTSSSEGTRRVEPTAPLPAACQRTDISRLNASSSQLGTRFKGKLYKMPVCEEIIVGFQKKK